MRLFRHILSSVAAIAFFLFLAVPDVRASGQFQADYDVQYAVSPAGKTIVTQHITLTNKEPDFYPREYSLLLDSDKISNVIAYDDGGVITPEISVKDNKTRITLTFNVKSIGLGKTLKFSLRYEHSGIASRVGSIWEIYVPGVVNDPDIGTYDVTLSVPPSFGPAAYISPAAGNGNRWTKDQMIRGGIAAAYGKQQSFDVTLSYVLTNDSASSAIQEIALPPDTAYQEVVLTSLEPKPTTVIRDDDGNWLAKYALAPHQSLSVTAGMVVSTFLTPRTTFQQKPIAEDVYLREQKYWQISNPDIVKLAQRYTTPRAIYDYVSTHLSYAYEKVTAKAARMGAVEANRNPKEAVCMEFTDLFIAIARAANIPARRVVGYAYTNNPKLRPLSLVSDILHAWPEYYDREQGVWVPVDPTWANTTGGVDYFTKLDFNHIVFAIQGIDSEYPYPAGYYRDATKTGRDISVEFSKDPGAKKTAQVVGRIEFPEQVSAGTTARGSIIVENRGGESAYTIAVTAVSEPGNIRVSETIPELLPYAVVRIPIAGTFDHALRTVDGKITAQVNDALITRAFRIRPLYWIIGLAALLLMCLGVIGILVNRSALWKSQKTR